MSKRALAAALFLHILVCSSVKAESVQDLQGLLSQGKFGRVVERTDALLTSKPRDAQLRFLKGVALAKLDRDADAIAVFQKLTEDYPNLPEPYNNLAVLHAKQKQYDKARLALEAAIRLRPGYATAHENLGDVYAGLAGQAYDKAQSLDPSNAATRHRISIIREITSISPAKAVAPSPLATTPATLPARPAPTITAPKDTQ